MYFVIGFITMALITLHASAEGEEKLFEMANASMKVLCDEKGALFEDKYKKFSDCVVIMSLYFDLI